MLRDHIKTMIDRYSLSQVLESLSCAVSDISEDSYMSGDQKVLESIARILEKQSVKVKRIER